MKNLLTIFFLLCSFALSAQPLTVPEYKAKVNGQVREASGAMSITKEIIAGLYDDLANIVGKTDSAYRDSLLLYKAAILSNSVSIQQAIQRADSLFQNVPVPSLQQTANVGREVDSMRVSKNLFISDTNYRRPVLFTVIGDSRDQAVSGGPSYLRVWTYRLANYLGWKFDGSLAVPSTFFMNKEPRYNPLDDSSSALDIIKTNKIRHQSLMGDTLHFIVISRCINDLHYYTKGGGSNYTPENYGIGLRTFLDSLLSLGKSMDNVLIMGPKYVSQTSTMVTRDSVFRWIDTAAAVSAQFGTKFFNAFSYQATRGGDQLLGIDNFHDNISGHGVLFTGMLSAIGYNVSRDNQALAVNGKAEFNRMTIRGGDTSTINPLTVHTNAAGDVFVSDNHVIRANAFDSLTQEADANVHRVKARMFQSQGLNSVSFVWANNTAFRGSAPTGGILYFDASQDLTGTLNFRTTSTTTLSSTGLFNSVAVAAPSVRASTAFQGNAASNGTLYVDASQNTTGTINFRAGSTATLNSSGLLVTALNVNNQFAVNSLGVITEYGNVAPALNTVPLGTGTQFTATNTSTMMFDVSTTAITSATSISLAKPSTTRNVTAASAFTITLTGTVAGQELWLYRTDATANIVTLSPASGNINGASSQALSPGVSILKWNGTNWILKQ